MDGVKTSAGLIFAYMRMCGFKGWASFWHTIYALPGHEHNQRLLRHERKHLEQIERDGRVLFSIRYLWGLLRCWHWRNQYEVEARASESNSPDTIKLRQ